ncbi:nitroreductase [Chelatococcus caeni]|uniref:Putative NAD(P)H nitroreductase n=1 Tax=Chelatococcus caeni TaxID=1348468 RepID=A0A840BXC2_9HYPH|nr:nitroreductase [Chelatococcus caeni]MBB4017714.1 nitroreductase [Chelatococcus caeni]
MSNATIELLSARRSVAARQMQAPAPSEDELNTLLTLAARVPDHGKLVPWRFIVFSGEARVKAGEIIAAAFAADNPEADEKRLAAERERLTGAPLVVAVVSRAAPHAKIPEWEQVLSSGAVCMNLVVAANAMGFATSWITEWYAYDRRVLEALGLAASERIAGFVHIGTASETPADRPRPELASIVTRFGE